MKQHRSFVVLMYSLSHADLHSMSLVYLLRHGCETHCQLHGGFALPETCHQAGGCCATCSKGLPHDPDWSAEKAWPLQMPRLISSTACRIISNSFNNDKTFQNVLNHSFETFINLSQRSPEYISLFMDDKLRRGLKSMNEDDVEGVLDRVMMLFRYLQEKDVFEKYYKQHLAKRLLSGRTVSSSSTLSDAIHWVCLLNQTSLSVQIP